ncbi:Aldehyde dehydrogenase [Aphelenchoides bicaudatus]|nr:Aldehyde dehydrogenase [Aphelenchoides bicaudatus]
MVDYKQLVEAQHEFVKTNQPANLQYRREQLLKLKKLISENAERLTEAVYKDLRREQRTTHCLEIGPSLTEIDYCLQNLEEWAAPEYVEKTLVTLLDSPLIIREPLGVCLLIAPWNYPLLMVFLPLITMLSAGNTVLIKPSELSPATSQLFEELFSAAFEKRYITVIQAGIEGTTELLRQKFDHILYTGNGTVGRIIMEAAAKHLSSTTLELGGKCPAIVWSDADIEISARRIVWGKFTNNGQTCLAPDYVICASDVKEKLVKYFKQVLVEFYGSNCQESKDYSRIINERHFNRLQNLLKQTNGRLLYKMDGELDQNDLFIPPHLFELDMNTSDALMDDELFGPILPIFEVDSFDDALEFVNKRDKPLAIYIFTRTEALVNDFLSRTRSGAVTVNDVVLHITVDTLPFGGVGGSGYGAYHGKFGFEQFSHKRAVLKRGFFGESLASARYAPMTENKFKQLSSLSKRRSLWKPVQKLANDWQGALFIFAIGLLIGLFLK